MDRQALARFVRMPSASSLGRAFNCAPSSFLPRVLQPADEATTRGSGTHDFILRARQIGKEAALAEIPKNAPHRRLCSRLPVESLPEGGQLEVAFAYDPNTDTARILGYNIDRSYEEHGLQFGEIPGTADLQGVIGGDTVLIIDWKTGYTELDPAMDSWQLRFLALCACRVLGLHKARIAYWFLRDDGHITEDAADLDAFDLDETADRVRRGVSHMFVAASLDEPEPTVSLGEWCRYCECKEACPGMGGALKRLVGLPRHVELTRDRVGEAYRLIEQVKPMMKTLEEACKTFARQEPVDLGDGRVLIETPTSKTDFDPALAHAELVKAFGPDVAEVAAPRDITRASLERGLLVVTEMTGEPLAVLEVRAMKALTQAKAIRQVDGTKVSARKALGARKAG